ncbi:MAG: Fe-S oxidoreductase [Candidatus Nanoarchaeia archaeon]|nr:Fe-S oxidoreductase [Candidatus Nanoarchaeia archaeon]
MKIKKILLVEPNFPIPTKSKNHSNFLPIGLLKLASYYRKEGNQIELIRGNKEASFYPDRVFVTSLFTYWADYVKETVQYYKKLYPKSKITVGGIYATLMPKHCKEYVGCDKVFIGQHKGADKCKPAYDLVDVDYQIIHGMRGCTNKCPFCGIWKLEQKSFKNAEQIKKEICSNHLIFYDNNILVNPYIEEILEMLANTTYQGKALRCECQSGFDGRILMKKPHLAEMLKKARFENVRVAWDFPYSQRAIDIVEGWIQLLEKAGYNRKDIYVFMIYNWDYDYIHMELKRRQCYKWGVQIADCRYRPLDQTFDRYNGRIKNQTSEDYFIHPNWTDKKVKQFRRNVRKHNICIRHGILWRDYDQALEREYSRRKLTMINIVPPEEIKVTYPKLQSKLFTSS